MRSYANTNTAKKLDIPTFQPEIRPARTKSGKLCVWKSSTSLSIQPAGESFPSETARIHVNNRSAGQILDSNRADLSVIARIRELATYPDGWNGVNSVKASGRAINDAESFALSLELNTIHTPYISLSDDGEVNFWWNLPGFKLDIGFLGDGTYVYYSLLDNQREFAEDQIPISQPLPVDIMERLKKD